MLTPAVKMHHNSLIGLGMFLMAVLTAHQEQTLYWAQMVSYAVGVLAALYTIWSIQEKRREDKIEVIARQHAAEAAEIKAILIAALKRSGNGLED